MANEQSSAHRQPWWLWSTPLLAMALIGTYKAGIIGSGSAAFTACAAALLLGAVFSSVHHAEVIAHRIGQPFGAVLLALAITVIEVGLIISVMVSGSPDSDAIARDTVYATVMIVLNGIVGLCLVAGGIRYHEQSFKTEGAAAIISVIIVLAVLALILPNHTVETLGPTYSRSQLMFVGAVSLLLYGIFVFVQAVRHRDYFVVGDIVEGGGEMPSGRQVAASAAMLIVGLVAVILLAKALSPSIEGVVSGAGLPSAFVGVVIAAIVLLPEGVAAFNAAMRNKLQVSLNASLGSALASIGLTIPAVAAVSVTLGQNILLGVSAEQTVLLTLSLVASMLSFATGRTTVLQGCVHLVIFGVFLFLSAVP